MRLTFQRVSAVIGSMGSGRGIPLNKSLTVKFQGFPSKESVYDYTLQEVVRKIKGKRHRRIVLIRWTMALKFLQQVFSVSKEQLIKSGMLVFMSSQRRW